MIPNHARFIEAIRDRKKVSVRFYSRADSGVVDRVCAPMDYGPGGGFDDGLNRYWLWDYASDADSHTLGLVPQQILDLQVLGEGFDPAQFALGPSRPSVPQPGGLLPAAARQRHPPDAINALLEADPNNPKPASLPGTSRLASADQSSLKNNPQE